MDALAAVAFSALLATAQGVAAGVFGELTASAVKNGKSKNSKGERLRAYLASDPEKYGTLLDLIDSSDEEDGPARSEFEACLNRDEGFRSEISKIFGAAEVNGDGDLESPAISGGGNATASGNGVAMNAGRNAHAIHGNGTIDARTLSRADKMFPFVVVLAIVTLVGLVVLALMFFQLRSTVNSQNAEMGNISNEVNVAIDGLEGVATDVESAQGRIDGIEGEVSNQQDVLNQLSTGSTSPTEDAEPAATEIIQTSVELSDYAQVGPTSYSRFPNSYWIEVWSNVGELRDNCFVQYQVTDSSGAIVDRGDVKCWAQISRPSGTQADDYTIVANVTAGSLTSSVTKTIKVTK